MNWNFIGLGGIALVFFSGMYACKTLKGKAEQRPSQLIWSDEFNQDGLPDSTLWSYDIGDACDLPAGCGWGNNELQYYTDKQLRNARVENGHLIIEAHQEQFKNSKYTSARLVSRGKGELKYGRLEVRAKLPSGRGTWPAIWMLPSDWKYGGWPESGEIDIMEHVGYATDTVYATVHTKAYNHSIHTQKGGQHFSNDLETAFHVYAINWTAEKIDFYIDEVKYFTFLNENLSFKEWPFDQLFYLLLNIAVGGNWGGSKGVDTTIWPQKMLVDYVRVYQHN